MDTVSHHAPQKQCTGHCGRWLPATLDYFYPTTKGRKPELRSKCRVCTQEQRREYLTRPEVKLHKRDQHKEYSARPEVRERLQGYRKEYLARPDARQHRQEYYARPEIIQREKDQKKEYHDRPEVKERIEEYLSRPDVKQSRLEWRKEYRTLPNAKELSRVNAHNRRSRKLSIAGTHTAAQIQEQLKRQKHTCYYCSVKFQRVKGRYIYHIDHTFPVSRVAGTDIPANDINYLVLACPHCNDSKGDKFPWEWPQGGKLL